MIGAVLGSWQLNPELVGGLLLVAAIYVKGLRSRRRREARRPAAFFCGLAAIYLALQAPLDAVSEHLFFVHQFQHLVLLQFAPALLLCSEPQGPLIAGSPRAIRVATGRILGSSVVRTAAGIVLHPAVATFILVATVILWNLPDIHDAAVRDGPLHELMHLTMLMAGLIYWWRILDRRPPPIGSPYIFRLAMLEIGMMVTVLLAGYLAMKETPLYTVYDRFGSVFFSNDDEMLGGFVLWIGGCILPLAMIVTIIRRWAAHLGKAQVHRIPPYENERSAESLSALIGP